MTDHDDRTWSIARLLYATQLPFLLIAWVVFVVAVVVLTVGIHVLGTVNRSIWDSAVTIVRWFALGYGLYLINRLLAVYVAHGRTRREFPALRRRVRGGRGGRAGRAPDGRVRGRGRPLPGHGPAAAGGARAAVRRSHRVPADLPELLGHAGDLDDHRAAAGRRVLPVGRQRAGRDRARAGHRAGDRVRDRVQRPALRRRRGRRGRPAAGRLPQPLPGWPAARGGGDLGPGPGHPDPQEAKPRAQQPRSRWVPRGQRGRGTSGTHEPHGTHEPSGTDGQPHGARGARGAHGARGLVAVVVMVPVLVGLALAAFAWPAARLAPRDVPVGVVAPAAAGAAIEQRLAAEGDAVEVYRFADEASGRAAIADRDVYGAVVVAPDGTTVLTASAASPLVAQLLQQAAATIPAGAPGAAPATPSGQDPGAQPTTGASPAPSAQPATGAPGDRPVRVVDVVAADPDDPRGAALAASVLPLVLAGMAAGLLVWLAGGTGVAGWAALVVASAGAGLVAAGVAQGWLGVLGGDWLVNAGVLGLTVLAVGATLAGLAALFGRAGAALEALLMVLIGNPLSGVSSAPELLPEPAGAIGQLLPPGAGGSLLRSTAFFGGAAASGPLMVLLAWVALGLAVAGVAALRRRRPAPAAAPRPDPVTVS